MPEPRSDEMPEKDRSFEAGFWAGLWTAVIFGVLMLVFFSIL